MELARPNTPRLYGLHVAAEVPNYRDRLQWSSLMRILSLRLIVALIVGITLVSVASSWYEVRSENDALRRDLEHKAGPLGESLAANAESFQRAGNQAGLEQMAKQYTNRDHLLGIAIFAAD